jgi:predicted GIY-YIG superfamily endonuclease
LRSKAREGNPSGARPRANRRVHILVWYETHSNVYAASEREKQIKGWNRDWKIRLIEHMNRFACGYAGLAGNDTNFFR